MENNSSIIRNPGYKCSQTWSTSVPFWVSTASKGHWIRSNPVMEKRNPILLVTGVAFSSSFDSGRSTAVGDVGMNGPCSQLPGCWLHCWAVTSSCATAAGPTEPCSSSPLGCSQALPPSQQLAFISIPPSSWALQLSPATRRGFVWVGQGYMCCREAFPHPFLELHGSSKRVCSTAHSMVARFFRSLKCCNCRFGEMKC